MALTGAERIARYRQRQKAAGKSQVWVSPAGTDAEFDLRDGPGLIEHWERTVQQLAVIQRAVRARETWLDSIAQRSHPDHETWQEVTRNTPDDVHQKLALIANDTDLRTIRTSRRPRVPAASRASRWQSAVGELRELQGEYQQWLDNLPEAIRMAGTPLAGRRSESVGRRTAPTADGARRRMVAVRSDVSGRTRRGC